MWIFRKSNGVSTVVFWNSCGLLWTFWPSPDRVALKRCPASSRAKKNHRSISVHTHATDTVHPSDKCLHRLPLNPFIPQSDQVQISPAALPVKNVGFHRLTEMKDWLCNQFSSPHLFTYMSSLELGSERVKPRGVWFHLTMENITQETVILIQVWSSPNTRQGGKDRKLHHSKFTINKSKKTDWTMAMLMDRPVGSTDPKTRSTLSLPNSKSTFSQPLKENVWVR